MARSFNSLQSEYLKNNTAVSTSYGLALVCWFKTPTTAFGYCLMSIMDRLVDSDTIALYCQGAVAGDPVRFQLREGVGAWNIADTTAGYTANTWHHACGIYLPTDRRVFLNGGNKGVDGPANCYPDVNATAIGVLYRPAITSYMMGQIAEAAVFNFLYYPGATDALKADYFETNVLPSLAAGYSPLNYPLGLLAHWPLHDENDAGEDSDIIGNLDLTPVNTPTWADHPRVFMPTRSQLTQPRSVLLSPGKLNSAPALTGKLRDIPAIGGKLQNEPCVEGKLKGLPAVGGQLQNRPCVKGKLNTRS